MFLPLKCAALAVCLISLVVLIRGLKLDYPYIKWHVLASAALVVASLVLDMAAYITAL